MGLVVGIDSSTRTGIALLDMDGKKPKILASGVITKPEREGLLRAGLIAQEILHRLEGFEVELIVIEGYSFGSKFNMPLLVEIGTITRYFLKQAGYPLVVCQPTSLKKFTCGQGKATKAVMLKEAHKRWGFDFTDDNECDAACLAMVGLTYIGRYKPPAAYMLEVAGKLSPCK